MVLIEESLLKDAVLPGQNLDQKMSEYLPLLQNDRFTVLYVCKSCLCSSPLDMEKAVQQTDYDALSCRLAAIRKGYLPSPSIQVERCNYKYYKEMHMEYLQTLKSVSRRIHSKIFKTIQNSFPVMNYGTYLRTVSIDLHLNEFLRSHQNDAKGVQVINLGCGSDLRMIQILRNFQNVRYLDIDFDDSVNMKLKILHQSQSLSEALELNKDGGNPNYNLISSNLNDMDQTMSVLERLTDPDSPTIVITECVLCYMNKEASQELIEKITSFFKTGLWISYDPIGGSSDNDRFGIIMQNNLRESRHLEMPTLMLYNSKETYCARFTNCNTIIQNMWEIFQNELTPSEVTRLKSLQFLDEIEELQVMQLHYVLSRAAW